MVTSHELGLSKDSLTFFFLLRERKEEGRETHKQAESEERETGERHGETDRLRHTLAWEAGDLGLGVLGNSFSLDLFYFLENEEVGVAILSIPLSSLLLFVTCEELRWT